MKIEHINDEVKVEKRKGGMAQISEKVYDCSCFKDWMYCKRYFYERYMRLGTGIEPLSTNIALNFGSLWHEALHTLDTKGDIEEATKVFKDLQTEDERRTAEHGEAWLREYALTYKDEVYETRDAEVEFHLDMPNGTTFSGRIDRVCEDNEKIGPMDHKSSSSLGKNFERMIKPNIQFRGYCFAVRELVGRCDFFILDGVSTAKNPRTTGRFKRIPTVYTDKEMDSFLDDYLCWAKDVQTHIEWDSFPMEDHDCSKYGGCPFSDICIHGWSDGLIDVRYRQKERKEETSGSDSEV